MRDSKRSGWGGARPNAGRRGLYTGQSEARRIVLPAAAWKMIDEFSDDGHSERFLRAMLDARTRAALVRILAKSRRDTK